MYDILKMCHDNERNNLMNVLMATDFQLTKVLVMSFNKGRR